MFKKSIYSVIKVKGWLTDGERTILDIPGIRDRYFKGSSDIKTEIKEFLDCAIKDLEFKRKFYKGLASLTELDLLKPTTSKQEAIDENIDMFVSCGVARDEIKRLRDEIRNHENLQRKINSYIS